MLLPVKHGLNTLQQALRQPVALRLFQRCPGEPIMFFRKAFGAFARPAMKSDAARLCGVRATSEFEGGELIKDLDNQACLLQSFSLRRLDQSFVCFNAAGYCFPLARRVILG